MNTIPPCKEEFYLPTYWGNESYYPDPLKEAIHTMYRVVKAAALLEYGDPRANMIETQLGYSLRQLEIALQPGAGMGHGLVGIFEIIK